jgi:hypothetical protein
MLNDLKQYRTDATAQLLADQQVDTSDAICLLTL